MNCIKTNIAPTSVTKKFATPEESEIDTKQARDSFAVKFDPRLYGQVGVVNIEDNENSAVYHILRWIFN